jgi:hypothetical protein
MWHSTIRNAKILLFKILSRKATSCETLSLASPPSPVSCLNLFKVLVIHRLCRSHYTIRADAGNKRCRQQRRRKLRSNLRMSFVYPAICACPLCCLRMHGYGPIGSQGCISGEQQFLNRIKAILKADKKMTLIIEEVGKCSDLDGFGGWPPRGSQATS